MHATLTTSNESGMLKKLNALIIDDKQIANRTEQKK